MLNTIPLPTLPMPSVKNDIDMHMDYMAILYNKPDDIATKN